MLSYDILVVFIYFIAELFDVSGFSDLLNIDIAKSYIAQQGFLSSLDSWYCQKKMRGLVSGTSEE